jgi:hypothetical protein
MFNSTRKSKMVKVAAATATIGSLAAIGIVGGSPAQADPQFTSAFVAVGSDTTQDVMNALAGYAPSPSLTAAAARYEPAIASNGQQLISWNALNPADGLTDCIATKLGGPSFDRPNGSSNGRRALSRAEDGTGWGSGGCAGPTDVGGLVDVARSSSGPASGDTGTDLTYSVLGRDAVSVAFYRAGVAGNTINPLTSTSSQVKSRWTRAEITALFSGTGAAVTLTADDGVTPVSVLACGIQTGSGTYSFTRGVYNVTAGQEDTATGTCNALGTGERLQENDALGLKGKGDAAPANTQVVVGFSAGAYIAKSNGVAVPDPQANAVGLAAITNDGAGNNIGLAYTGTAPNLAPNPADYDPVTAGVQEYYNNSIFGRNVYNVVPTAKIDSLFGNDGLKSMFKGPTAAICAETTTIETFGFRVSSACGDTSRKGSFLSGQVNS